MIFDSNKSIILWIQGQSNMVGGGFWSESSSTGLYGAYNTLKSTQIHANLLCRQDLKYPFTWDSDAGGDLYEQVQMYKNHTMPSGIGINMMYSFMVDLMAYLDGISYTKNVWNLNHAIGGTSLRSIVGDIDWADDQEIFYESTKALEQAIAYEKDVNGNDSQVICFWHQGEADVLFSPTQLARLQDLYTRQKNIIGSNHQFFMGQLVEANANNIAMNDVFFDFAAANSNVHVVGEDLPGGISTWQDMENTDPNGLMDAADFSTFTNTGDGHINWQAQVLQGKQLYDLVIDRYFT